MEDPNKAMDDSKKPGSHEGLQSNTEEADGSSRKRRRSEGSTSNTEEQVSEMNPVPGGQVSSHAHIFNLLRAPAPPLVHAQDPSLKKSEADKQEAALSSTSSSSIAAMKTKQIGRYTDANAYLYHGIGGDFTKLALINQNGILTAADGEDLFSDIFVQSHGKTQYSTSGGTNKEDSISTSSFDTPSFHHYNKPAISFMINKGKLEGRMTERARGVVEGEVHVKGSLKPEDISYVYVPKAMLKLEVKDCVAQGVLEGSSDAVLKCKGFLSRVDYLYKYKDEEHRNHVLGLASQLDKLYETSPANNSEARDKHRLAIDTLKKEIEGSLGEYFHGALQGKSYTVKEYLENLSLNRFQPIVFADSVYTKPQNPELSTNQEKQSALGFKKQS